MTHVFHSSVRDVWSCPLWAVRNNAAVINIVWVFVCTCVFISLGYIRRSGIARSYNTGNTFKQDRIFANERILFHSRGLWPSGYDSFLCVFFCSRAEDVIPEIRQGTWLDFWLVKNNRGALMWRSRNFYYLWGIS